MKMALSQKTTESILVALIRMLISAEVETDALRLALMHHCQVDHEDMDRFRNLAGVRHEHALARVGKLEGSAPMELSDLLQRLEGTQ